MPEGIYCNRRPITTEEDLKALLADKGGQKYYCLLYTSDAADD